jgi:hypothetical protein
MDITELGVRVQTAQLKTAKSEMLAFAASGKTAQSSADGLAASTDKLATSSGAAARNARSAASSFAQGTANVGQFGITTRASAAYTANLATQINDIGVMLMAGQNPLQMAVQQGTQVTQVFNQMGGGMNAIRGIGVALTSVINPLSIITLGTIAFGGYAVQAFRDATGGAESFDDMIDKTTKSLEEYYSIVEKNTSMGGDQFKAAREQLEATSAAYQDLITIAKLEAFQSISNLSASLADSVLSASWLKSEMADVGDLLDIETVLRGNIGVWKDNREAVGEFKAMLEALSTAGTLDEQYAAALALRDTFKETVDVNGELNAAQQAFWKSISQTIQQMEIMGAAVKAVDDAMTGVSQKSIDAYQHYANMRVESEANLAVAQEMLDELNAQAEMQATILVYGKDSAQVAKLHAAEEKAVFEALLDSKEMSDAMRAELMLAFQVAQDLTAAAGATASNLTGAAAEAARLAQNLNLAAAALSAVVNATANMNVSAVGLEAQNKALAAGNSLIQARTEGMIASKRAELSDAFGSEDAIVRAAATAEMENYTDAVNRNSSAQAVNEGIIKARSDAEAAARKAAAAGAKAGKKATSDAEKEAAKAAKEAAKSYEEQLAAAAKLTEKYWTPLEKHADALRELNDVYAQGHISLETYNRALKDIYSELDDANMALLDSMPVIGEMADAFGEFTAGGMRDFDTFAESVLNSFRSMLAQMVAESIKNNIMLMLNVGGGGSAAGGGIGSSIVGAASSFFGGARANGGSVEAGKTYTVGEQGVEQFTPSVAGYVSSATQLKNSEQNSSPAVINQTIMVDGATGNSEVRLMVAKGVQQGMAEAQKQVPGVMANHTQVYG